MIRQGMAIALVAFGMTVTGLSQDVDWQMDLDAAKTRASQQGKLVLIHFSANWCRPCQHLETFVFTSPKVITAIDERVIPVHIDTDLHPELVKQYNVTQIPTDIVITPTGRIVQKRQSPKDAANYLRMLESLDTIDKAMSEDRAALAQKIEHILDAGRGDSAPPMESNSFVPRSPQTENPGSTQQGRLLQARNVSQAKLIEQVSANEFPAQETDDRDSPGDESTGPQRVINEQFFNEKSNAAEATTRASIQTEPTSSSYAVVKRDECDGDSCAATAASSTATLRPASNTTPSESGMITTSADVASHDVSTASAASMAASALNSKPETAKACPQAALEGNCPVTLLKEGRWQHGDPRFGCIHRGKTYLFADQEKLVLFQTDPDGFSPVLAGYDPVIFHERGELVDGVEQHGVFMGKAPRQRVVLFQNAETRRQFQQNPRLYMSTIRVALKQSDNLK